VESRSFCAAKSLAFVGSVLELASVIRVRLTELLRARVAGWLLAGLLAGGALMPAANAQPAPADHSSGQVSQPLGFAPAFPRR
jgi:hypothetical protein